MMMRKEVKFIAFRVWSRPEELNGTRLSVDVDDKISCRDEILSRNRYAQMYTVYLSKRGLRDKYPVNSLRIDMTNH